MGGTLEGGKRAAETNKQKYGEDFYSKIGAKGGSNGHAGGFAANIPCGCDLLPYEHLVRHCAGKKGGTISRRPRAATL